MEIEIDQLGKRYQHGWVFQGISHHFESGNIYGISGRNGSGKSTFLKIISGLLTPSKGKVMYRSNGTQIKRDEIYAYVSIAAPYTDLIEEYSLREMISFHSGLKPSDAFNDVRQWIDMLDFPHTLVRPLYQYSSGMKQRVKLGLALYSKADIVILDEPTSNLDDQAKHWFFEHLINRKSDRIILIASNETSDFKYCSEILPLH